MAELNAIYESKHSGELVKVTSVPDGFGDNEQVEFRTLSDDEWYGVYQDNFRKGYKKVADSEEKLEADEESVAEELQERANESWDALAREFGMTTEEVREAIVGGN